MQRNTFHGDLAYNAGSLGKWFRSFEGRFRVQNLRRGRQHVTSKRREQGRDEASRPRRLYSSTTPLWGKEKKNAAILSLTAGGYVTPRVCSIPSCSPAWDKPKRWWRSLLLLNESWLVFVCFHCARCSHNRKVVSILLSFRVFVSHVSWPA
jgi:hypothetical protein